MDEKLKNTIKNILAIGGSIAVACALLDEISDSGGLEFEKLAEKPLKEPLQLSDGKEKPEEKHEPVPENEIAELKRKLAEYESKQQEQPKQDEHSV